MASVQRKRSVLVLGVHEASEGYPNVLHRLDWLRTSPNFDVLEINVPLGRAVPRDGAFRRLPPLAVRAFVAHLRVILLYLRAPDTDVLYVPYPSILVLNTLSMLPKRANHVIADVFISMYDTVVSDRKFIGPRNPLASLLYRLERRAYRQADLLVVDTRENAGFLRRLFDLPTEKIAAVPLSTNEEDYCFSVYRTQPKRLRVLFIGTLVPLHGAGTIVEAAGQLRQHTDLEFRLIGTGQDASVVERLIDHHRPNLTWLKEWHSPSDLAHGYGKPTSALASSVTQPKRSGFVP